MSHAVPIPAIDAHDLKYSYGRTEVFSDLSFQVQQGDYLGVIGPNGGGKTTLLKLILGLLEPSAGTLQIFGENAAVSRQRSLVGYVPQRAAAATTQFPATVEEIVRSGRAAKVGALKRFSHADLDAVEKSMLLAGVFDFRRRMISDLSGGERQKVYIARALACDPRMLILDEPTAAIDVTSQEQFYDFLAELNQNLNLTIILVSHDIDVIAKKIKSVLCVNRGLVCQGVPAVLMRSKNLEKIYGSRVNFVLHGH